MILKNLGMIAAMDEYNLIGDGNKLPWSGYTEDIEHFFNTISGKRVIFGYTTFELCLPEKVRTKIYDVAYPYVMSTNDSYRYTEEKMLNLITSTPEHEYWVCGGAMTYRTFFPYAYRLSLTTIKTGFSSADPVRFPIDRLTIQGKFKLENSRDIDGPYGEGVIENFRRMSTLKDIF